MCVSGPYSVRTHVGGQCDFQQRCQHGGTDTLQDSAFFETPACGIARDTFTLGVAVTLQKDEVKY